MAKSRLQAVLELESYNYDIVNELTERCPGSYIKGLPITREGDDCEKDLVSCKACWEEVYSMED